MSVNPTISALPTIEDSNASLLSLVINNEREAIVDSFLRDFNLDLESLPSLDLPHDEFVEELEWKAFLSNQPVGWECESDAFTR